VLACVGHLALRPIVRDALLRAFLATISKSAPCGAYPQTQKPESAKVALEYTTPSSRSVSPPGSGSAALQVARFDVVGLRKY
jgi:hypothetical protein